MSSKLLQDYFYNPDHHPQSPSYEEECCLQCKYLLSDCICDEEKDCGFDTEE